MRLALSGAGALRLAPRRRAGRRRRGGLRGGGAVGSPSSGPGLSARARGGGRPPEAPHLAAAALAPIARRPFGTGRLEASARWHGAAGWPAASAPPGWWRSRRAARRRRRARPRSARARTPSASSPRGGALRRGSRHHADRLRLVLAAQHSRGGRRHRDGRSPLARARAGHLPHARRRLAAGRRGPPPPAVDRARAAGRRAGGEVETLRDQHRLPPGEGVLPLAEIVGRVRALGADPTVVRPAAAGGKPRGGGLGEAAS